MALAREIIYFFIIKTFIITATTHSNKKFKKKYAIIHQIVSYVETNIITLSNPKISSLVPNIVKKLILAKPM